MAKRKPKKSTTKVSLQLYISTELRRRIRKAAEIEEISESAYCRRILATHVPGAVE